MKKVYVIIIVAFLFNCELRAQVSAIPFSSGMDVFTPISGTNIPLGDDVSFKKPIGFNFNFGGVNYDSLKICSNGWISFNLAFYSSTAYQPLISPNNKLMVAPYGCDLVNKNTNASWQYITLGTAPNRIFVAQWLHLSYFIPSLGYPGDINFQVMLYETSNCIKFVYGNNTYYDNANVQIGLKGNINSDFIALTNNACNWSNAYASPTNSVYFPTTISCNMPAGFSFNFGACPSLPSLGRVSGKVFFDDNGNGTLDTNETGIANRLVNVMPGNDFVSTNVDGEYSYYFTDSTQTYNFTGPTINYTNQTSIPVISCNPTTQNCTNINFGYQAIPGISDIEVHCHLSNVRPGILEPFLILYRNNGPSIESDTITFVMDSLFTFVNAIPSPLSVNGQEIKWLYNYLQPFQHASIQLNLLPSLSAVMGSNLNSTIHIGPANDTVPANNEVILNQLVVNSYDPNEKTAQPSGMIESGTRINYTVHFQNTGNAEAYHVVISDTLDQNLDLTTFEYLGATHPCVFNLEHSNIAKFYLYNIMLPDSGTDMAGSNGAIFYSVKTKANLAPLTVINNKAGIYFDYNEPIITNTTADTIQMPVVTSIVNQLKSFIVSAKPNPTNNNVVFVFSTDINEIAQLTVTTLDGKIVLAKDNISSKDIINLSDLSAGVYLCHILSKNYSGTIKVIKN